MKTKIFTLLLAVAAGIGTMFASNTSVDGIWYNFNSSTKTATVTYRGLNEGHYSNEYTGAVVIPASVQYNSVTYSVTGIGPRAFSNCTKLTSVTIPESITSVGGGAFSGCSGLKSVVWNAKNAPSIAFGDQVTSFTIGAEVEVIPSRLCSGMTKLTSVTIPNSVTSIGNYAFYGCSGLKSVMIGNSVKSIGDYAFGGCNNIISVVWNAKNCDAWNFGSQVTSFTLGENVEVIPDSLCSGMKLLAGIVIPNSVTSIGKEAFKECTSLATISIPNSVTSIGGSAFSNCTNLASLTIGNSVTSLGDNAFSGCSGLTSVHISNLSAWCSISFKNSGSNPLNYAHNLYLNGELIKNLVISNDITEIMNYAFKGCSCLTSINTGNSVISIGNNSFSDCDNITSLTIGNSVISLGDYAFSNCSSLTSVTIPSSVTSIGESAFQNCSSLTSVIIPSSVTNIGGNAFYNIDTVVYCGPATGAPWGARNGGSTINKIVIDGLYYDINYCDQTAKVRCKSEEHVYESCSGCKPGGPSTPWDSYRLLYINYNNGWNITKVNIPDSIELAKVTTIGEFAFYRPFSGNTNLESVSIPQGVKSIGGGAFALCTGLTSVSCYAIAPPSMGTASWTFEEVYTEWEPYTQINNSYVKTYGVFGEVDCSKIPLYVPRASVEAYRAADQWKDFKVKSIEGTYTITFQDYDGTELLTLDVMEDSIPVYKGAIPARPEDDVYVYTFSGWTPIIEAAISNTIYTATYTATPKSYTITWLNEDGSLIDKTTVEYGVVPTHANPAKAATEEFSYTFAGWTPNVVAVTGDATYKATFTATKNSYTITWQNEDGSLIDQTTVEYGVVPTHVDPVKLNTAEYTYTFAGWTPAVVAVTGNATYKATFTATKNSYTITWQDENGLLIDQTTVEYGVVPTHAEPTKEATEEYTYTFTGWIPAVVAVTGDATYKATFSSVVNVYTISVSAVNGQVIGGGEYQYGATIDLNAIPNEGYVFDQWSDGVKDNPRTITVTGDAEYTALFTSTEGFENIYTSEPVQKVIIDQKVYILRDGKTYTIQGVEVKCNRHLSD